MLKRINRIAALIVIFCMMLEQSSFAQVAPDINIPAYLSGLMPADRFRPMHARWLSYDSLNNSFDLAIEQGDGSGIKEQDIKKAAQKIMEYFQVGIRLPDSMFWVNLRPDAPDDIIDPYLSRTDMGRIMLEADLQLKKDLARFTSPDTKTGRQYWDKLYARAHEIFGNEDISIPTVTRPWIVPNEIIIKEYKDGAYVYKATMKVMLEQDYLSRTATDSMLTAGQGSLSSVPGKGAPAYAFDDPRVEELNAYSSQLVRELIIPQLTRQVNSSKRYASLRQVFYSLILAQWFKQRYAGIAGHEHSAMADTIDNCDLSGLGSKVAWSKQAYFDEYVRSFQKGEYNKQETVNGPYGMTLRQYFSGGILFRLQQGIAAIGQNNQPLMTILPAAEASQAPAMLRASVIGDPQQYKLDFMGAKMNISVLPKQNPQPSTAALAQPSVTDIQKENGKDGGDKEDSPARKTSDFLAVAYISGAGVLTAIAAGLVTAFVLPQPIVIMSIMGLTAIPGMFAGYVMFVKKYYPMLYDPDSYIRIFKFFGISFPITIGVSGAAFGLAYILTHDFWFSSLASLLALWPGAIAATEVAGKKIYKDGGEDIIKNGAENGVDISDVSSGYLTEGNTFAQEEATQKVWPFASRPNDIKKLAGEVESRIARVTNREEAIRVANVLRALNGKANRYFREGRQKISHVHNLYERIHRDLMVGGFKSDRVVVKFVNPQEGQNAFTSRPQDEGVRKLFVSTLRKTDSDGNIVSDYIINYDGPWQVYVVKDSDAVALNSPVGRFLIWPNSQNKFRVMVIYLAPPGPWTVDNDNGAEARDGGEKESDTMIIELAGNLKANLRAMTVSEFKDAKRKLELYLKDIRQQLSQKNIEMENMSQYRKFLMRFSVTGLKH